MGKGDHHSSEDLKYWDGLENTEQFMLKLFTKLNIVNKEFKGSEEESLFQIQDLDDVKPFVLDPHFSLDKKIVIRSTSNLNLRTGSQ